MVEPSGDHWGLESVPGLVVNRLSEFPCVTQISVLIGSFDCSMGQGSLTA